MLYDFQIGGVYGLDHETVKAIKHVQSSDKAPSTARLLAVPVVISYWDVALHHLYRRERVNQYQDLANPWKEADERENRNKVDFD